METISIAFKKNVTLTQLREALEKNWTVQASGGDSLAIQENNSRIYIHLDSNNKTASAYYDCFIDYFDIQLVKNIIQAIADRGDVLVDNDFGTVLPGDQFVQKIKNDPEWNWKDD